MPPQDVPPKDLPSQDVTPGRTPPPVNTTARLRTVGTAGVRRMLGAYSGEHGVYGIVLVTAVIAVGWRDETDFDVLVFLLGTVVIFWLAHIYAGVVASRGHTPPEPLSVAIRAAMKHSSGMLVAMLIPAALLSTAVLGWVEEYTAYFLALGSGLLMLALIGYFNAARNGSTWPWRIAGVLATTLLGAFVIGLSILVH